MNLTEYSRNQRIFRDPALSDFERCQAAWALLRFAVEENKKLNEIGLQFMEVQIDSYLEYVKFIMQCGASFELVAIDILETLGNLPSPGKADVSP